MRRRKFIEISSKGTLVVGAAPVVLNNFGNNYHGDVNPTEGYLPAYSKTVPRARRSTVKLITDFPKGTGLQEYPVTFGVPFPRGAIADINNIRIITDKGEEVPAQLSQTATWHSPEGDLKWVLVDMTAKPETNYLLEYGSEVTPNSFNSPLKVNENDSEIIIETGPLRIAYSRDKSFLPGGVWLSDTKNQDLQKWQPVSIPNERMYMVDHNGVKYCTSDRPEDYEVAIEDKGPMRVTVKVSGWYRNERGEALCQYITRINHYAGQPFVRVVHTFIIGFDTDKIRLRDIGFPLNMEGDKLEKAVYQTGLGWNATQSVAGVPSFLIQETADEFSLYEDKGDKIYSGKRSGAWVSAVNNRAGICVGLRNFWQDYPRELEVRENGLVVHLWPAHGNTLLDFGARFQLGPRYDEWDRVYWQNWYRGGIDKYDQAYGLAKTNELLIAFHLPEESAAEYSRLTATALEEPPLIHTDPLWMAESDVFGPLIPLDHSSNPIAEQVYEAAWDHFEYLRENIWNHQDHIGNYGFFDYGDVNYSITFNEEEERWEPRPWRRMASRFYGSCILPWIYFIRSGDRRHLRWAIDNARHVMDIDMCHLTDDRDEWPYPKYAGGRYGGNGGIIHYAGNIYAIGPDSHVAHLKYFYYLTGDKRAWDVLIEEGEFYLGINASGIPARRKHYAHRASGGALRAMIDLWEATWDKRYLEVARDIADTLYAEAERNPESTTRCDDVYMNPGMVSYYQATGDKRMRDLFIYNMRKEATLRIPTHDPRAFTGYGPSMAFYFTGDNSFLCRPKFLMQQYFDDMNLEKDPLWRGIPEERWPMAHNTVQMIYGPYLLKALAESTRPVKPAEDLAATTGEIWIENTDGGSFTAVVYWSVLSRPFHHGINVVREWPAYAHHNNLKAEILVIDPAGKTVKNVIINYADHVRFPYNSQDYPFSGQLSLNIPTGLSGTYRIVPRETGGVPLKIALLDANGRRWGLPVDRGGISHGSSYYFHVPVDTKQITLRYKFLVNARKVKFNLIDEDDRLIASQTLSREDLPTMDWVKWVVPLSPDRRKGLWRLVIKPSLSNQQILYLKFDELKPFVSLSAEEYFLPPSIPDQFTSKTSSLPDGMKDKPRSLESKESIKLIRGRAIDQMGGYEHLDARCGTLEFWIQPDWDVTDFRDATLLQWGGMKLIRRSQRGTELSIDEVSPLLSGFILMPDHWYHIAITWDVTGEHPFLRLLINNTEMAVTNGPEEEQELRDLGDWTSDEGTLGGAAMTVGDVRILKTPEK